MFLFFFFYRQRSRRLDASWCLYQSYRKLFHNAGSSHGLITTTDHFISQNFYFQAKLGLSQASLGGYIGLHPRPSRNGMKLVSHVHNFFLLLKKYVFKLITLFFFFFFCIYVQHLGNLCELTKER